MESPPPPWAQCKGMGHGLSCMVSLQLPPKVQQRNLQRLRPSKNPWDPMEGTSTKPRMDIMLAPLGGSGSGGGG